MVSIKARVYEKDKKVAAKCRKGRPKVTQFFKFWDPVGKQVCEKLRKDRS